MKFRYSALSCADFCLTKFKLQYLDGVEEPGMLNADLTFGTAMHMALEYYFQGHDPRTIFSDYWRILDTDAYDWKHARLKYNELYESGMTILEKWLKYHAKKYKALHVEKWLEFTVGDYQFTGKPDFVGWYEDKLSVVDFKTSAAQFDKRTPISDDQLWVYRHAVEQVLGDKPTHLIYAPLIKTTMSVQAPIICEVTQKRLDEHLNNVKIKCKDLITRSQWPKNSKNCLKCRFFDRCHN